MIKPLTKIKAEFALADIRVVAVVPRKTAVIACNLVARGEDFGLRKTNQAE